MIHHQDPLRLPHNVESGYDTIIERFAEANFGVDINTLKKEKPYK